MDEEVKEFHNHMAHSMSGLMQAFNDGFAALDKAKKEEGGEAEKKPTEKTDVATTQDVSTSQSLDTKSDEKEKSEIADETKALETEA